MQSRNLAARAARWSAQHRKKAIFGWLAFVIVAFVVGGAVGHQAARRHRHPGNGDSQVADKAIDNADFPDQADEQVLVQGRGCDQGRRRRVHRRGQRHRRAPEGGPARQGRRVPAGRGNKGQLSKDGRSALVTFKIAGDDDLAKERVDATAGGRRRRAEGQPAAARRAVRRRERRQGAVEGLRRTTSRRPSTSRCRSRWLILLVAFGALVAAGAAAAARADRGVRRRSACSGRSAT